MAKVTLVRVPSLFAAGALTLSAVPPISLAYIAGSLRKHGNNVTILDSIGEAIEHIYYFGDHFSTYAGRDNLYVNGLEIDELLERIPSDSKYIGIAFPFSSEYPFAKIVCLAIKKRFPDAILIGGGEHITALPEHTLRDCTAVEYCILGEGEETMVDLIKCLDEGGSVADVAGIAYLNEQGECIKAERRSRITAIDEIPEPAWDLVPLEAYLSGGFSYGVNIGRTIPILATRGCPYQCTFCSNPSMWTTRWIARKPINVILEMEEYIKKYRIENFDFYDLTAIVRKDWVVEFCNLLIDRKLNVSWQLPSGTRSEAMDSEVTALLYRSGCRNISYAPESGSMETLKKIKKRINPDRMIDSMKSSVKNKINIKANLIVGFPGEKFKNILQTYKFIIRMAAAGVDDISVWTFSAYPGSEIFNDLERANKMPEFDDKYFLSLLSYSDLKNVVSWNENFSNWQLKYLRIFGLVLFYAVSYLIRPAKLIRTIRNISKGKPESRLEMIVNKALLRHKSDEASKKVDVDRDCLTAK